MKRQSISASGSIGCVRHFCRRCVRIRLRGKSRDLASHQVAELRTVGRSDMRVVIRDVFDIWPLELPRSHSAKSHQWIRIINFDHPSDFTGQGRFLRKYRRLQRNDRIDVIGVVCHQHCIVRAQAVADDKDVCSIRLTIDVVNQRRP